jgi:hypothetical protein
VTVIQNVLDILGVVVLVMDNLHVLDIGLVIVIVKLLATAKVIKQDVVVILNVRHIVQMMMCVLVPIKQQRAVIVRVYGNALKRII